MKRLCIVLLIFILTACNNISSTISEDNIKLATTMIALREFEVYDKDTLDKVFTRDMTNSFLSMYMPSFQEQSIRVKDNVIHPIIQIKDIEYLPKEIKVKYTYDYMPEDLQILTLILQEDKVSSFRINDKEE